MSGGGEGETRGWRKKYCQERCEKNEVSSLICKPEKNIKKKREKKDDR